MCTDKMGQEEIEEELENIRNEMVQMCVKDLMV